MIVTVKKINLNTASGFLWVQWFDLLQNPWLTPSEKVNKAINIQQHFFRQG
jgi:hypothetical protein